MSDPDIVRAAVQRNLDGVKKELDKGVNIESRTMWRQTSLHFASRNLDSAMTRFLIDSGADVSAKDIYQRTPLHMTVMEENAKEVIEILVEAGAEIDAPDRVGGTPLAIAVAQGRLSNCKILIEKGADFNTKNISGVSCLHVASCRENKEMVEFFVNLGLDANMQDLRGDNPLQSVKNAEIVKILIDNGADPLQRNKNGISALHYAADKNLRNTLECIIDCAYNVDAVDECGNTPLLLAIRNDLDSDIMKMLLDRGANPLARNKSGQTALHRFRYFNKLAHLERLLKYNHDVNLRDNYGNSPLHYVIEFKNLDAIKLLTQKHGANLNSKNKYDESLLHRLAIFSDSEILEFILENSDLKVDELDNFKNTPLLMAFTVLQSTEFAKLLIQRDAQVEHTNRIGQNAFHKLVRSKFSVDCLLSKSSIDRYKGVFISEERTSISVPDLIYDGIKFLTECGLNINSRDHYGNTPLIIAACGEPNLIINSSIKLFVDDRRKHHQSHKNADECEQIYIVDANEVINNLEKIIPEWIFDECQRNLDLKKVYQSDKIIFETASEQSFDISLNLDKISVFLENNANVNDENLDGNSALSMASFFNNYSAIDPLFENGASIEHKNKEGNTPLIIASMNGNLETVQNLLEKGANLYEKNDKSETALMKAMEAGHTEVENVLTLANE